MLKNHITEKIAAQLSSLLEDTPSHNEFKDKLKGCITAVLQEFDLVTKEEFEIQKKVLQRTRLKLEALEKKLNEAKKE